MTPARYTATAINGAQTAIIGNVAGTTGVNFTTTGNQYPVVDGGSNVGGAAKRYKTPTMA